jgi:hypothetical protein
MFGWLTKTKTKAPKVPQYEWTEYKGYRICAAPKAEGSQYRVSGIIEKDGEVLQSHTFVRADIMPSEAEASTISLSKARLMVDQLGDKVFAE